MIFEMFKIIVLLIECMILLTFVKRYFQPRIIYEPVIALFFVSIMLILIALQIIILCV